MEAFLQTIFPGRAWTFTRAPGSGHETYFACAEPDHTPTLFIKLGAHIDRAAALSKAGLSPPVLASGTLGDGTTILVQQYIEGRPPTRADYRAHLAQVAAILRTLHHDPQIAAALSPPTPTQNSKLRTQNSKFQQAAFTALSEVRERWSLYRHLVLDHTHLVDSSLSRLEHEISTITGEGLVSSHNDFCRPNLLLTPEGTLYLLDLDSMAHDDPARDLGATLWWYYPPELWPAFLAEAGYPDTPSLRHRMRIRHALHSLLIALPRRGSFDTFHLPTFADRLRDFHAILEGQPNPEIHLD